MLEKEKETQFIITCLSVCISSKVGSLGVSVCLHMCENKGLLYSVRTKISKDDMSCYSVIFSLLYAST